MSILEQVCNDWATQQPKLAKRQLWDANANCGCAQGDVLHRFGGYSPSQLCMLPQATADKETARVLGISVAHAILLRNINDSRPGCPHDVLVNPEKILGKHATFVLAFWLHLDSLDEAAWVAAADAAGAAAGAAARARAAAGAAAVAAARAWDAAWDAAWVAARASWEIQGHELMKAPLYFLPLFGIASIDALREIAAKQEASRGPVAEKGASECQ